MKICEVLPKIWVLGFRVLGFPGYMGVPTKIGFFFLSFEVTYPPIFKGSEANGAIKFF
jgi:hypothetical protein